jgi:cysteine synthase B
LSLQTPPLTTNLKADIIDAIGNTPMVELTALSPDPAVQIFAKLESANPTGSIKDRVAKYMVLDAERRGLLKPGGTIMEPTSGNTGIGLAMIAAVRGYRMIAVMPESVSKERVDLLKAYGAEIVFSDAEKGTNESIILAKKLADEHPDYFMPYQYGNEANPRAHYETTGPEIIRDLPDVDIFIAGLGTGGTLMGVGRALREHNPKVKIVATAPHPDDKVQGLRSIEHGFIPPILDLDKLDARIMVEGEESFYWTRKLLLDAGIFAGVSSGATFATAHKLAQRMSKSGESGKIVVVFADGGWKYLSTGIYNQDFKFSQKEIEGKTWW